MCQQSTQYIQTVAAQAGGTYQFHYTAKTAGTNQNVLFGIKFLSSSWNVLATNYSSFDSPTGFTSNFIEKLAPAGTAWVEVSIAKQNTGCIQVSEVCLTKTGLLALQSSPQTYIAPDPLQEVTIYPNPATQQAFIDLNMLKGAPTNIHIYDAYGKLHHTTSSTATVVDLDLTGWESGVYMVRLEAEGVRARVMKLVVVGL
jgi:Secretion system C-terminal sorting domain